MVHASRTNDTAGGFLTAVPDPRARGTAEKESGWATVVKTPLGTIYRPSWFTRGAALFSLGLIVLVLLSTGTIPTFERVEEQNCCAMLVFCTILWATEARPHPSGNTGDRSLISSLSPIGHPAVRHVALCAFPRRRPASSPVDRRQGHTTLCIGRDQVRLPLRPQSACCTDALCRLQVHILADVLTHHHASHRRVHHRCRAQQNSNGRHHGQADPQLGRNQPQHGPSQSDGCRHLCQHVDQ